MRIRNIFNISFHFDIFGGSLLQATLSRIPIDSNALQMDAEKILEVAKRMASSLVEYFQAEQFSQSNFNSVLSALRLNKSLNTRTWYDRQFYHALNLSEQDVDKLLRYRINTVEKLLAANPREIEDVSDFFVTINYANQLFILICNNLVRN